MYEFLSSAEHKR